MATITVTVSPSADPTYLPNKNVTQSDTVSFQLASGSPDVDVYFDHPTYLQGEPDAPLHVGSDGASMTINEQAPKGSIKFSVVAKDKESRNGELDVTTDPPPPPKEKKQK